MGHGPRNHFDAVIKSAGGDNAVPGDYLYRSHTAIGIRSGILGVFRVSEAGMDAVTMTAKQTGGTVYGFNTVNPTTGKFADSVDVYSPGTRSGNTCTGTKIATIPLNHGDPMTGPSGSSTNGAWWFAMKAGVTTACAVSNTNGNTGGVGTLDLATILPACTNVMPPAGGAHKPNSQENRVTDMTDMFTKTVPHDTKKQ